MVSAEPNASGFLVTGNFTLISFLSKTISYYRRHKYCLKHVPTFSLSTDRAGDKGKGGFPKINSVQGAERDGNE